MSENEPTAPRPNPGLKIPLEPIGSGTAPFLFIDGVPNMAFVDGIARMTLEAIHWHTDDGGNPIVSRVIVAHLRMSMTAIASMERAIAGIKLLANPPASETAN